MARRSLLSFLTSIVPPPEQVSDAVLLNRYVKDSDHAAFELVLRRHADTVWSACRGILRNETDAEDAFQATFLVLAKRAKHVVAEPTAAGWLYRVAVNAALKLKATRRPQIVVHDIPDGRVPSNDSAEIIHQELNLLRENDRLPVVLCDLEGHTREQAAAILGWPVGTVNGRLSRARDQLRERLLRRGVVAPAAIATFSASTTLSARAAAVALGLTAVPVPISLLTNGVLTAMTATQFKWTAALAAGVMLAVGTGTMMAVAQVGAGTKPGEGQTKQPAVIGENVKLKRAATKLESGRIVLFPELAKDPTKKTLEEWQQIINSLLIPGDIPHEEGVRRIRLEQYRAVVDAVNMNFQVALSGQWEVPFLNQYLLDLELLATVAKKLSLPKADVIRILKARLTFAYHFEEIVYQRVHVARNLRFQQLFQTRAMRHAFELDLAEAEDAKAP